MLFGKDDVIEKDVGNVGQRVDVVPGGNINNPIELSDNSNDNSNVQPRRPVGRPNVHRMGKQPITRDVRIPKSPPYVPSNESRANPTPNINAARDNRGWEEFFRPTGSGSEQSTAASHDSWPSLD